jgi:exopolysaccharide production protein ExoQ
MGLNIHNIVTSKGHVWKPDNRYSILLACMMGVLIVMMVIPDGFNYAPDAGAPTSGSTISRLLWLSLLGIGGIFTLWRIGLAWLLVRGLNPFLLLFVVLAVMSIAWSIDSSLTVRRLVRLITFVLVCTAFVLSAWHARRFQNIVRAVLTLLLFGSIVFCLVSPQLAIHWEKSPELYGAWHGLATQKNGLGALACFGVIFWFHAWLNREVKLRYVLLGIAIAAICLIKSKSDTSLITALAAMVIMTLMMRAPLSIRPYRPLLISVAAIILLIYALTILRIIPGSNTLLAPIMALTGKDMSFSGRSDIWAIVSAHIDLHPILGTGYAAYWDPQPVPGHDSFVFPALLQGFYPGSSHNGYLEVMNDLGWVGLILLLGFIFVYMRQSIQLMAIDTGQGALYIGLFFQQAITNLSESHWFDVTSVDFVFMMLATMAMARSLLEHRLRTVFGDPYSSIGGIQDDLSGRMQTGSGQFQHYKNMMP